MHTNKVLEGYLFFIFLSVLFFVCLSNECFMRRTLLPESGYYLVLCIDTVQYLNGH
jgi:hypothetical protein